ncbi:unnamed protein product [Rhodiola kirilowii]
MKKIRKESSSIRLAGQRSITSSLTSRSSDRSCISKTGRPGIGGKISLSEFLSKKLHKSSVLPDTSKDKEKLSSSLVRRGNSFGPLQNGDMKVDNATERTCHLDKSVFDKFKPVVNNSDEETVSPCIADDLDSLNRAHEDMRESKKRLYLSSTILHILAFESDPLRWDLQDGSECVTKKRRVVVLGDDPGHSSCINKPTYKKSEQSVPLYNHYANGRGWWDSNMEGVDNEEVGSSEVWEGVGSTTLGGLDWH